MIRYRKGRCPAALEAFAATPGGNWNSFAGKQAVREALVADQRGVCAYCQQRIHDDPSMKIEHWLAQSDPDRGAAHALEWGNLIGVCPGYTEDVRHCDTSRAERNVADQPLYLHPVEGRGPDPRQQLRYQANGRVYDHPADPRVDHDISVLNLNAEFLRRSRNAVVSALEQVLKKKGFTTRHLQQELDRLDQGPEAVAYVEVARDYLRRKLRRLG